MDIITGKAGLSFLKVLLDLWHKLFPKKDDSTIYLEIPKRTIIIAPRSSNHNTWWHMGSVANKPAMQVVGRFQVTNITKYAVILSAVKMKKPRYMGTVMVTDSESDYHGMYQVPPGGFTDLSFDFWIVPPFKKQGDTFSSDVAVLDQFGNEHWIKNIIFKYR
jgi:hypothetical protein